MCHADTKKWNTHIMQADEYETQIPIYILFFVLFVSETSDFFISV